MDYTFEAVLAQGPAEPLMDGIVRAGRLANALDEAVHEVAGKLRVRPDLVFPHPPGEGEQEALRPVCVLVRVASRARRRTASLPLIVQPPEPRCWTIGREHTWEPTGYHTRACIRCGLVERAVEGGRSYWYKVTAPLPQEVAQ